MFPLIPGCCSGFCSSVLEENPRNVTESVGHSSETLPRPRANQAIIQNFPSVQTLFGSTDAQICFFYEKVAKVFIKLPPS